jgi:DNA-binding MarR family transcriptional regulator
MQVTDRRTRPYGLVFRAHIDTDKFRALPPSARIVYFTLTTYAGAEGQAWPKQSTLAAVTGYDERTIRRATADLEGAGFILVEVRNPDSYRRTNIYTLIDPT